MQDGLKFKKVKHRHEKGHFHELTFSCYRKLALLTNDTWRAKLATSVQAACSSHAMELTAFVFMPDHVHLLVFPTESEPDLSSFLASVKRPFSREIRTLLETATSPLLETLTIRERPGKYVFRFWQEGPGYDRNLFTPDAIQASIRYIHKNPVEKRLCKHAIDWKWSSARYYLCEPAKQQFHELPHIHGLRPEALTP